MCMKFSEHFHNKLQNNKFFIKYHVKSVIFIFKKNIIYSIFS